MKTYLEPAVDFDKRRTAQHFATNSPNSIPHGLEGKVFPSLLLVAIPKRKNLGWPTIYTKLGTEELHAFCNSINVKLGAKCLAKDLNLADHVRFLMTITVSHPTDKNEKHLKPYNSVQIICITSDFLKLRLFVNFIIVNTSKRFSSQ